MLQDVIAIILILFAVGYVVYRLLRKNKGKNDTACNRCAGCKHSEHCVSPKQKE